jgi:predicted Holliday junction resolvase-like endonuclease
MEVFIVPLAVLAVYALYRALSSKTMSKLEEANQKIGTMVSEYDALSKAHRLQGADFLKLKDDFEKLQFNKISSEVKLGQKAEHLLPFLESFPYKDDEIKGLFQPVDLIVFRQDEVVFVEVKTGAAQLSEKERRIRDNIKAGRVRFEVHRMNEKGVSVK